MNTRDHSVESYFAKIVSFITLLIHIYNFFTCFFFMGIQGYPTDWWFVIEIVTEVFMVFELIIQMLLRTQCQFLWKDMYMMHDSIPLTKFGIFRYILVSIPRSIILRWAFKGNSNNDLQLSFGFSCVRLLKLFRWDEVQRYFNLYDLKSRQRSAFSFNRALFIIFYFQVFMHFWSCIWLMTGRMDFSRDIAGWYRMANFD